MNLFQTKKMAENFTITNVYCAYVENLPMLYPPDDIGIVWTKGGKGRALTTGWQIVPNFLWSHVCTPKQWAEFIIQNEAYHVESIKATIFNPVPITTNIAIQRTNLFAAFNNCTYCWGYDDDLYETNWYEWNELPTSEQLNLAFKEGIHYQGSYGEMGSESGSGTVNTGPAGGTGGDATYKWFRYRFPHYFWQRPYHRTPNPNVWGQGESGAGVFFPGTYVGQPASPDTLQEPSGIFWDPLNRPDHIMELRAGKNSMSFNWHCHEADEQRWYNLDLLASWAPWTPTGPFCGGNRPNTYKYSYIDDPDKLTTHGLMLSNSNPTGDRTEPDWWDYTVPDYSQMPIVPCSWWWQEMSKSIAENEKNISAGSNPMTKIDKWYPGTEYEQYKYPPSQWFTKGIPLFDQADNLIRTTTQVSCKITINLKVKKRRSALYAPTWGPFAGKQLYRHNLQGQIYQPAVIRYRTAGARRTWQNITRNQGGDAVASVRDHPREDPYNIPYDRFPIDGSGGKPRSENTDKYAKDTPEQDVTVTMEIDKQRVTFQRPKAPIRRRREQSPGRTLEIDMMTQLQEGP